MTAAAVLKKSRLENSFIAIIIGIFLLESNASCLGNSRWQYKNCVAFPF
jgi:hypothetical protein